MGKSMGLKHSKGWITDKTTKMLDMTEADRLDMVKRLVEGAPKTQHKVAIALHYIYGMRPAELISLRKSNFVIIDNEVRVTLPTMKGGHKRIIVLDIGETPFLKDLIVPYISSLEADSRLFPNWNVPTNVNYAFEKAFGATGLEFNPNLFRHFRMSYLGYLGANMMDLKSWKGAKSLKSVEEYLELKPIVSYKKAIK